MDHHLPGLRSRLFYMNEVEIVKRIPQKIEYYSDAKTSLFSATAVFRQLYPISSEIVEHFMIAQPKI